MLCTEIYIISKTDAIDCTQIPRHHNPGAPEADSWTENNVSPNAKV